MPRPPPVRAAPEGPEPPVPQPEAVGEPARQAPRHPRRHRRSRPQLPSLAELDGRTNSARALKQLIRDIEQDLGGADQLSTIERELVAGFAGAALTARSLNIKLALGQDVLPAELSQSVSTMVRVAHRLGHQRRQKDVTPSLSDLLHAKESVSRRETNGRAD